MQHRFFCVRPNLNSVLGRSKLSEPFLNRVNYCKTCERSIATISVDGSEHRIVVYDHYADRTVFDVELEVPCMGADISHDGRFVAVGYWERSDIDVWEIATCARRKIKSPTTVSRVLFDGTGEWLLYQSERGTFAASLGEQPQTRIAHADDLRRATFRTRDNAMLVPLRRKGQIAVIRFGPARFDTVVLPIKSMVSCIRHSPVDDRLFVLDGTGKVCCYDDELQQRYWQSPVDKRAHIGAFSGDGRMIGLHVSQYSGPANVVVLDAGNGRPLADFHDRYCTGSPYLGDSVLLDGPWPGMIFHLHDGSIEEGIAGKFGVRFLGPNSPV